VPRADRQSGLHGNNNRESSFQVEDGSYVRLGHITLGYTMPTKWFGNSVKNIRVYVTGRNLITLTKYLGYNPEVSNQSESTLTPGEDYGAYPLSKVYTLGVNLSL